MLVFLDASAVIYLLEGDAPTRRAVRGTLERLPVEGEVPTLAVSALSRLECRVRPLRASDFDALGRLDDFFDDPGLVCIPLDTAVLDRATELRARFGLRTPDAIQAASCLVTDPDGAFVTGDGDFHKVPDLRVYRVQV